MEPNQNNFNIPTAAVAAALATTNNDDENKDEIVAKSLQTIESLTTIYGFDKKLAKQAVDAIANKSDVQEAVEYILDNLGGEDKGGAIYPKYDCPHVDNNVNVDMVFKLTKLDDCCNFYDNKYEANFLERKDEGMKSKGKSMKDYEDEEQESSENNKWKCISRENWICLECGEVRCSRYVNGHSIIHWESTKINCKNSVGHCIALSISDLSIWCYMCQSYIIHPKLDKIMKHLEFLKFGGIAFEIDVRE